VRTYEYLTQMGSVYWPAIVAGVAIALLCAVLSVLVVLKRLAFIGQGVSHAAFGGIGLAAVLGLAAANLSAGQNAVQFGIVAAFCAAAALLIGGMSGRSGSGEAATHGDTAIGITLVASMALGAILARHSRSGISWEAFLFGSLLNTDWTDAAIAWVVAAVVIVTLWAVRRPLLFWSFDEPASQAFGVRGAPLRALLMLLLALATVTAMRLAGVVIASAMLVLPGAIALRMTRSLGRVLILAGLGAVVGVLGGLVLSFEADWPPGPSIVAVLTVLFAAAAVRSAGRRAGAAA